MVIFQDLFNGGRAVFHHDGLLFGCDNRHVRARLRRVSGVLSFAVNVKIAGIMLECRGA